MYRLLLIILLYSTVGIAQSVTFVIPDSLKTTSYEEIFKRYEKVYQDTLKSKIYLNTYYKKAILDGDEYKQSVALSYISYYIEDYTTKAEILDLAIHHAKQVDNDKNLMIVYSFAGGFYTSNLSFDKGLDFYFKSLAIAEKINHEYYKYVNKHNIALIKGDIGDFKESLEIFRECYIREVRVSLGEEGYIYDYLISGISLSEAFIRNKQLDSASHYLKEVKDNVKGDFFNVKSEYYIYKHIANTEDRVEGYTNLVASLKEIKEQEGDIKRVLLFGNYHAGIIGEEIKPDHYYKHFEQVDSIYTNASVSIPEVRLSFEKLIKYHKKKNNLQKQLLYVDKLLKFDSIHGKQFKVLTSKINENYDTPVLLAEKESLIHELNKKNTTLSYGSILLFTAVLLLIALAFYLYTRTRILKERFNKVVINEPIVSNVVKIDTPLIIEKPIKKELLISSAIVNEVLGNLAKFEDKKQFINKNLTSTSLAKKVGTNSKYLSQIINHFKNKNITSYINDLRIEYSIELLKSDTKILNYTIQSIAEEVGFNNAESFSKAFFKKTNLKPSYFIKQLRIKIME